VVPTRTQVLTSAVEALSALPFSMKVTLYSDSQYVIKGMSEWIVNWKKKNWKDVKNVDLWKKLDDISQKHVITWRWVRGHDGNLGNERADALANKGVYSQY
jgi:ribonuclease HI